MSDAARQLAHCFHFLGLRKPTLAFPQSFLDVLTVTDVVDHAGKMAPTIYHELTDGQMKGKGHAIFAPAADLAPDADDLLGSGLEIIVDVAVVFRLVGLRHQDLDVLPDELADHISEQALGCRIDAFDNTAVIDGNDGGNGGFEDAAKLGSLPLGRRQLARGL